MSRRSIALTASVLVALAAVALAVSAQGDARSTATVASLSSPMQDPAVVGPDGLPVLVDPAPNGLKTAVSGDEAIVIADKGWGAAVEGEPSSETAFLGMWGDKHETPVWVVEYQGCIVLGGGGPSLGSTEATRDIPSCLPGRLDVIIDATTGEWITTHSGA